MRRLWPCSLLGRTILVLLLGVLVSNLAGLAVYVGDRLDVALGARGRQIAQDVSAAAAEIDGLAQEERRPRLRAMRQPGLRLVWSRVPWSADDLDGWRSRLLRGAFHDELGHDEQGNDSRRLLRLSLVVPGIPAGDGGAQPQAPDAPVPGDAVPGAVASGDAVPGAVAPGTRDNGAPALRGREGPTFFGEDGPPPPPPPGVGFGSRPPPGPPWGPSSLVGGPGKGPGLRMLVGSLELSDGTWLNFEAPVAGFPSFWGTPMFFILMASTAVVLMASVWAVRRATKPLAMFGEAAERLGRDVNAPPLAEAGPLEVERAARAFNRMQERLQRLIRDRTQMLGAISHDLRTPLTRLRLRAELIEDEEQQRKTIADLEEMQAMISAALAFARDEASVERPAPLDLSALLQTVCDEASDAGSDVVYEGPEHVRCVGRPAALKRALANLVENAVRYGDRARVELAVESRQLRVSVDDDGPGVPEAELERVFQPFYRVESSRSRATGGVGLGLALVRAAIDAHGGRVELANRPRGGLRATVLLPLPGIAG